MKVMEADACGPVVTQLLKGTANKKPKVPPECLKCLTAAYAAFGAKAMPNPDIIGKLKDLLQATVRANTHRHATALATTSRRTIHHPTTRSPQRPNALPPLLPTTPSARRCAPPPST